MRIKIVRRYLYLLFAAILIGLAVVLRLWVAGGVERSCPAEVPPGSLLEQTYVRLDDVRNKKKAQLLEYLNRVGKMAEQISRDSVMREYFRTHERYFELQQSSPPPADARRAIREYDAGVLAHCLDRYSGFKNILLVSSEGTIFHAVRSRELCGRNLFEAPFCETRLARRLSGNPFEAFVDYQQSCLSQEPSAFFVQPAMYGGRPVGWFLLQCSITKINNLFLPEDSLGSTGEVFLVNQNCQMLTDSRFRRDSSILTQHLSPENIRSKFAEGKGHKIVTDYRGEQAITSFEVCPVMGSKWLLIAKIDKAEVLTEYYKQCREQCREPLIESLLRQQGTFRSEPLPLPEEARVVDLDEFHKTRCDEQLVTYGVSTCTAIMIHLPGEFAYLGHASIYDTLYGSGSLDLLSNMLKRIRRYEICPYQMRRLEVVLVAPHAESIGRAIDKLVDAGIFLDQIHFLCNPDSSCAEAIWHEVDPCRMFVKWKPVSPGDPPVFQSAESSPSVGEVFSRSFISED